MMTPTTPPKHLSPESKCIWREMNDLFEFDLSFLVILKVALEAYDRLQHARKTIKKEGLTVVSSTLVVRKHPAIEVEKDSRAGMLQAWRMLNVHLEPPK